MTLLMRDKENRAVGETIKLVSLIRDVKLDDIDIAVKFLKTDKEYILYVKNVIEEHPELDDEEIAEIIVD